MSTDHLSMAAGGHYQDRFHPVFTGDLHERPMVGGEQKLRAELAEIITRLQKIAEILGELVPYCPIYKDDYRHCPDCRTRKSGHIFSKEQYHRELEQEQKKLQQRAAQIRRLLAGLEPEQSEPP